MTPTGFFLLLASLLVLVTLTEAVRIGWYLCISKRLGRTIQKFARSNPSAMTRILFIGDSTGYGVGTTHESHSIVGRIGNDFPDAHIENISESGLSLMKTGQMLSARTIHPDHDSFSLAILMVGGMDLVHHTPLWLVRRRIQGAIIESKKLAHKVLLVSPNNAGFAPLFRFPLAGLQGKRAKQFDALYRELAQEESIHFVSLFREERDPLLERTLFALDKTHPNDEGYGLWYEVIKTELHTALHP